MMLCISMCLTDAIGRPELRDDPRFATRSARHDHYTDLDAVLKEAALEKTRDEWFAVLAAADIPHAAINGFEDLFEDPQVAHLGVVERIDMADGSRPLTQVGPPIRLGTTPLRVTPTAPRLSEHTDEVLAEVGYDGDEIARMRADGTV